MPSVSSASGWGDLARTAPPRLRFARRPSPCRAGQSHMGIEKRTKRNRLWNKSTEKGLRFPVRSAYAIPLPLQGRVKSGRGFGDRAAGQRLDLAGVIDRVARRLVVGEQF